LSTLDPAGAHARDVAVIWWVMLAGGAIILGGVTALALYSLRARLAWADDGRALLVWAGLIFPIVSLAVLMSWALARGDGLLAKPDPSVPVFEAHGTQFAWVFTYPGRDLRTSNILHVPAGTPFHVRVTSEDVIHSFWVPRLGGKIDAVPGKANMVRLEADSPGRYYGVCAEYCGTGHAGMSFVLQAHPPSTYEAAVSRADGIYSPPVVGEPRRSLASDRIEKAFYNMLRWIGIEP
jgi:cytochrome c oxidase subunit 2